MNRFLLLALLFPAFLLSVPVSGAVPSYVWPLSNSSTEDAMTTSFGPRVNYAEWDFHDGIDLPAAIGTPCHAVLAGKIFRADAGGADAYSSRHVILKVADPSGATIYANYLHLSAIEAGIVPGVTVSQGDVIGYAGDDDATWSHLHFEMRKNDNWESSSIHPLGLLPYSDTANFTVPGSPRFNVTAGLRSARLEFGAGNRQEGDLKRVEADLMDGVAVLSTRTVDFDDKTTVREGNDEANLYTNDMAVEGYQTSNMVLHNRPDLSYGVLVRNLPAACDGLAVRVMDWGGHTTASGIVPVPVQTAFDENAGFESGGTTPTGWSSVTSSSGTGTTTYLGAAAARRGTRGLVCVDDSTSEGVLQSAGIGIALPGGRYEWMGEGWIKPVALGLAASEAVYLLEFTSGAGLSCAAYVRNVSGDMRAGIAALNPGGVLAGLDNSFIVPVGEWHHWRLAVYRVGTRETTSVLWIDGAVKQRFEWSSTEFEPTGFVAGLSLVSPGATASVLIDGIRVTEQQDPAFPSFNPDSGATANDIPGDSFAEIAVVPAIIGAGDPGCVEMEKIPSGISPAVYTPSGRLVVRLGETTASSGRVRWCLEDSAGRKVARGVYLVLFRDSKGHKRIVKLLVKR